MNYQRRMDMSEYQEPLPTELEQIVDEARRDAGLGPAPREPGAGVADMEARIAYHARLIAKLQQQIAQNLTRYHNDPQYQATMKAAVADSTRQLNEARGRKYEYEIQRGGQN